MIKFPNCKINIGLWVTAKRPDGFHEIETLMMPVPLCDVLEIHKSDSFAFNLYGDQLNCPAGQNLCEKAWSLMNKHYNVGPVRIDLLKKIPSGAGLGGGSSDAAHTLIMLNELFGIGLCESELQQMAIELGSDCAFFIRNQSSIATGRGELLREYPLTLSGMHLVIIKPNDSVSTAEAYSLIKVRPRLLRFEALLSQPIETWRENIDNNFEKEIFIRIPQLNEIKQMFYTKGALYASMSGSGSAIYGLFKSYVDIQHPNVIYCGQLT